MIAIVNVSAHDEPTGKHDYEVRINRELIASFTHNREDGLAECLRRAAESVDRAKQESLTRMVMLIAENTDAKRPFSGYLEKPIKGNAK